MSFVSPGPVIKLISPFQNLFGTSSHLTPMLYIVLVTALTDLAGALGAVGNEHHSGAPGPEGSPILIQESKKNPEKHPRGDFLMVIMASGIARRRRRQRQRRSCPFHKRSMSFLRHLKANLTTNKFFSTICK